MRVSIVIPCHNAEPYLAQTVRSALQQTLPPHEVIVVDDGSTDGSLAIALSLAEMGEGPVRVLSERSGNAARTRNLGALAATGDGLMFLDADDVIAPTTLEALSSALERDAGAGLAICPWSRLDRIDGRWVQRPPSCRPRRRTQDALAGWLTGWYHPPCSVMWTRDGFERAGRWEERFNPNDDGDLMMRALALGHRLAETSAGGGYYRRLPSGGTLSGQRFTERGLLSRARTIRKIATLLEQDDRLDAYRTAIGVAFDRIAADASDFPGIVAHCRELELRFGPTRAERGRQAATRAVQPPRARVGALLHRRTRGAALGDQRYEEVLLGQGAPVAGAGGPPGVEPEDLVRPAVSVILPTYQRAHLLSRAIDSVLAQTFADFELIVVDDGSTDGTGDLVARYDDQRIRYLAQPNAGVSAARNNGLRHVRGDLIAFLDSDDEWLPHKLELQVARMTEVPDEVGLLYGGVENVGGSSGRKVKRPQHRGDLHQVLLRRNVLHGTSGVMMRRCVVAAVGFFDEGIPAIEDYDYWLRASRFFQFDYIDEPLIRYFDVADEDRKSLVHEENHEARRWLFRKHRSDLRRHGVEHLFLVESARRQLERSDDVRAAQRLAVGAARRNPAAPEVRDMLFRSCIREPLRRFPPARRLYARLVLAR